MLPAAAFAHWHIAMLYPFILCLAYAALALAIPTWQSMSQWTSAISPLVPGASSIQAVPIDEDDQTKPKWRKPAYLMLRKEKTDPFGPKVSGGPGNTTIGQSSRPPLFYINKGQLYQSINASFIYPVNVKNVTGRDDFPLQISVGEDYDGMSGGTWRWQGTRLFYDYGSSTNMGIYYSCRTDYGFYSVGFYLKPPSKMPAKCTAVSLHSLIKDDEEGEDGW